MADSNIIDDIANLLRQNRESTPYVFVAPDNAAAFFAPSDKPEPAKVAPVRNAPIPPPSRPAERVAPVAAHAAPPAPEKQTGTMPDLASMSLEELAPMVCQCTRCRLHTGRTNGVFGEGNPNAELMFIGEGPGYDEDMQGRPFVGKAGQLLDKMITAMQFSRETVYIANIVKCRPPENRNPEPDEAAACLPYLQRQIDLISPRVIVLLGSVPLEYLLGMKGIKRLRGQWLTYNGIPVMPTYHPAYLLRYPEGKKEVWADLQLVMKVFGKVHVK